MSILKSRKEKAQKIRLLPRQKIRQFWEDRHLSTMSDIITTQPPGDKTCSEEDEEKKKEDEDEEPFDRFFLTVQNIVLAQGGELNS